MVLRLPKYPRYTPVALRPPGAGALFDFAVYVMRPDPGKLKSCSLAGRFGKLVPGRS